MLQYLQAAKLAISVSEAEDFSVMAERKHGKTYSKVIFRRN